MAAQGNHPLIGRAALSSERPALPEFSFGSQQNFVLLNLSYTAATLSRLGSAQFTNRRSRTLFTSPNIKNVDNVFEPPALISGSGMPTTGILPTTIPTFTNK